MADDERLLISLEARITDFEKKMAQAEKRGTRTYTKLRQDSGTATKAMETDMSRATGRINQALAQGGAQMGALGKTWAIGLVGGMAGGLAAAGLSGIIGAVGEVAKSVATVGDEAKRAGVSAKAFQEWKFVAEQNRIGIDAMVDGLKELNLRADEFAITGKGSAAEAFARLGYGAEEVKRKLEDPSALLLEIIGRLEQMDSAAQIRIADELFGGTAGERFVELLAQGEDGIRSTITAANDLGVIMDDELIAKAAELDRNFNAISATVGTALKSAIVTAADSLTDFINRFREFQHQSNSVLRGQQLSITSAQADAADQLREIDMQESMGVAAPDSNTWDQQRAQWETVIADRQRQLDQIDGILNDRAPPPKPMEKPTDRTWTPPAYVAPPASGGGGSGGRKGGGRSGGASQRADEFERETEQLLKRTAALKAGTLAQAEINPLLQDFGFAAEFASARAELLLAAQQAGIPITAELKGQIDQLALGYANAAAASEQLETTQAEAMDRAQELGRLRQDTIGGFAKDLLNGVDAADAFNNALGRIADRLIDMALTAAFPAAPAAGGAPGGMGGLGTILGGLRGFLGFASGTANTGGRRGEPRGIVHGQEAVIPLPAGGSVPVEVRGGQGGGSEGGGAMAIELNLGKDLEARILKKAGTQSVQINQAGLAQMRREVPGIVTKHQLRNG
jgi:hypothetical protein